MKGHIADAMLFFFLVGIMLVGDFLEWNLRTVAFLAWVFVVGFLSDVVTDERVHWHKKALIVSVIIVVSLAMVATGHIWD